MALNQRITQHTLSSSTRSALSVTPLYKTSNSLGHRTFCHSLQITGTTRAKLSFPIALTGQRSNESNTMALKPTLRSTLYLFAVQPQMDPTSHRSGRLVALTFSLDKLPFALFVGSGTTESGHARQAWPECLDFSGRAKRAPRDKRTEKAAQWFEIVPWTIDRDRPVSSACDLSSECTSSSKERVAFATKQQCARWGVCSSQNTAQTKDWDPIDQPCAGLARLQKKQG